MAGDAMKVETFAAGARAKGHSVRIDRKNRCATTSDTVSDGYRIDTYVHFDENRDITHSYTIKVARHYCEYDKGDYAGGMALIPLRDLRWEAYAK